MNLEHIWFDCDGTLYVQTPEMVARRDEYICSKIVEKVHRPRQEVSQQFQNGRKQHKTRITTLTKMFHFSDAESIEIANATNICDLLNPDPILNDVLISLKNKGLEISVYTNSTRPKLTDVLASLNISSSLFRYMITIEDGGGKPAGYSEVIVRSKCNPSEIMFVGDNLQADIEPARDHRMNTLLVGSEKPYMELDTEKRTYHFRRKTIYEVVPVVEELEKII